MSASNAGNIATQKAKPPVVAGEASSSDVDDAESLEEMLKMLENKSEAEAARAMTDNTGVGFERSVVFLALIPIFEALAEGNPDGTREDRWIFAKGFEQYVKAGGVEPHGEMTWKDLLKRFGMPWYGNERFAMNFHGFVEWHVWLRENKCAELMRRFRAFAASGLDLAYAPPDDN